MLAKGVARLEIIKLPTLTVPVPVGVKLIFWLVPVAVIVIPLVRPTIKSVTTLALLVILPVAFTTPPVVIFPPDTLPVAVMSPAVPKLPTLALPVTLNAPPVFKLPPSILPVAIIKPPVPKLPTLALPVTLNAPPVVKLPPDTLPVAVTKPAVPKLPTLALPLTLSVVMNAVFDNAIPPPLAEIV